MPAPPSNRKVQEGIRSSIDTCIKAVQNAFKSIIDINLIPSESGVKHSHLFSTSFTTISCVPFSGSITGEFFICVDPQNWQEHLAAISGLSSNSPEMLDLLHSTIKEISNTTAGGTIAEIKRTFGAVTMLSPRLIQGVLHYPHTQIFAFTLIDIESQSKVEVRMSFDLMEQEINVEHEKLKQDSRVDETGLFNKKYFVDFLAQMEKYYREKGNFSIIFADINRLKYVNDTYGHEAGDLYIKAACDLIKQSCRSSDYCFRIGGDELVIFVPNCSKESALPIVKRIERLLENEAITVQDENKMNLQIPLYISIGLASNSEGFASNKVYPTADERMENSKREWYSKFNIQRRK